MEKPFDLIVDDTKNEILNTLNNSGLPISILNMIIQDISIGVTSQCNNHLKKLRDVYEEELLKENQV